MTERVKGSLHERRVPPTIWRALGVAGIAATALMGDVAPAQAREVAPAASIRVNSLLSQLDKDIHALQVGHNGSVTRDGLKTVAVINVPEKNGHGPTGASMTENYRQDGKVDVLHSITVSVYNSKLSKLGSPSNTNAHPVYIFEVAGPAGNGVHGIHKSGDNIAGDSNLGTVNLSSATDILLHSITAAEAVEQVSAVFTKVRAGFELEPDPVRHWELLPPNSTQ